MDLHQHRQMIVKYFMSDEVYEQYVEDMFHWVHGVLHQTRPAQPETTITRLFLQGGLDPLSEDGLHLRTRLLKKHHKKPTVRVSWDELVAKYFPRGTK